MADLLLCEVGHAAQCVAGDVEGVLVGIRERGGAQRAIDDRGEVLREACGREAREG